MPVAHAFAAGVPAVGHVGGRGKQVQSSRDTGENQEPDSASVCLTVAPTILAVANHRVRPVRGLVDKEN